MGEPLPQSSPRATEEPGSPPRPAARPAAPPRRRRRSGAALLALVALLVPVVAAGCGSSGRSGASAAPATTVPTGTTFGNLASPCGHGNATGATDVGVTDTTVTIGYGDDAGYQGLPGVGHEMSDAVKAMMKWCNDQGGIDGRQVVGNYYDAKITDVANVMTEACQAKVFMMVGEGFVFDAAQEPVRLGCQLPAIPAYGTSPAFANGPLTYQPVPNPIDQQSVSLPAWYARTHPDKASKVAIVEADLAASKDTVAKEKSTWPQVGITFLACDQSYSIAGEADWKPIAQKLKDCGAQAVSFLGTAYPALENLLEAANQLDYHPDWLLDASFYDKSFAAWNTNGWANNAYVQMSEVPFEEASASKATQDYLNIVKANGGDPSDLGVHAASAFLLWATAARSCGSQLTRQCVLDAVGRIHDWTGGGLSGTSDVGNNMPTACGIVMQLQGTTWNQVDPTQAGTFDCRPDNVQKVSGPVVDQAHLGPDRRVASTTATTG